MEFSEPLLDVALVSEIFSVASPEDEQEVRSIYGDFVADVFPRLEALRREAGQLEPAQAAADLHRLRGAAANFGLARVAARLNWLEKGWAGIAPEDRRDCLSAAAAETREGLAALERLHPFLSYR